MQEKVLKELDSGLFFLASIKDDLNVFYYYKHKLIGAIDLAQALDLITSDQVQNFYNRLSLI